MLENVGYGKTSEYPARIVESDGFKAALAEMGLTENLIATSLVADIQAKTGKRLPELRLGAEILGMAKRDPEPVRPPTHLTYVQIFAPTVQAEIGQINNRIKAALTQPKPNA